MKIVRIALTTFLASAPAFTGGISHAQQPEKVYRVGALFNTQPTQDIVTLRKGLARMGYIEGSNLVIEARSAEGKLDRLPALADELVTKKVDVIVTYGGQSTKAAQKASSSIPIVADLVADPVALGFATTLEHPGGNITGVTNDDPEQAIRQLKLLREIFPKLKRVAFLSDPDVPGVDAGGFAPIERSSVAAAATLRITPHVLKVRGPSPDFAPAFNAMAAQKIEALVVLDVPVPFENRERIADLATTRHIPTMFWGGASNAGGLLSYGTSFTDAYSLMPQFVDQILKGAKPADTPFKVNSHRELVINLKIARELGITIPDEVLKQADHIIE